MPCPWTIVRYGCPLLINESWQLWLFLSVPFFAAILGAIAGKGYWTRIPMAALGAASRDLVGAGLVHWGVMVPSNPQYELRVGLMLAFLTASGAAIGATLAPYRGKRLLLFSGLGGFFGQFALLAMVHQHRSSRAGGKRLD